MLRKSKLLASFLSVILISTLIGCNAQNQAEAIDASGVHKDILQKMDEQKHYSFKGNTSLTVSGQNMEDFVKFNGFVNNKENVYLDLSIAGIEGMRDEKMSVLQAKDQFKVKYSQNDNWQDVSTEDMGLYGEFRNWSPEFLIKMMKENTLSTEPIENKNNNRGLLIKLDPEVMKGQIEEQIRLTMQGGGLTEQDIKEMKENLGLTDQEIEDMQKDLENQMQETNRQIEEMFKTMKVDSYYELYYDPDTLLITEINQNTNSNYELMGEKVEEKIKVNMQFLDYGKEKNIPEV